jgi:hypothetical protein
MKRTLLLVVACIVWSFLGAQDRQGKQLDDQEETKKYKFTYEKTKLAEGVSASVPKGFRPMTDGEMKQKFPNFHKPVVMMTSEDEVANFGYNISFNQWGRNLKLLKEFMKSNNSYYFKDIQYLQDTISALDGRNFIILEFVSYTQNKETDRELAPIRTYSYMMYTVEDNRILVFNYTCPARYMDKWKQAAPKIMSSIHINSGLDLNNATTQVPKKTKGKKPSDLAKGQAKQKSTESKNSQLVPTDSKAK